MRARLWIASGLLGSALLLAGETSRAAGADPTVATPDQVAQAQTHFASGKDLATQNKLAEALAEFQASYGIVASPNAHLAAARTMRDMGKFPEAYVEYGLVADEASALIPKADRYKATADAATDERAKVQAQIALITVTVANAPPDATLTVGAATIDRAAWAQPIPLYPGATDVVLSSGGKELSRTTVTLAAGDNKPVAIDGAPKAAPAPVPQKTGPVSASDMPDFNKAPPPTTPTGSDHSKLRPYAYVAGGVGVVGLAMFTIFGLMEKGTFSNLQTACPNNACPPGHSSDISTGQSQELLANIGLIVGAVGVAAGVTLFVLSMPSKDSQPKPSAALVVSPTWIGLRGTL